MDSMEYLQSKLGMNSISDRRCIWVGIVGCGREVKRWWSLVKSRADLSRPRERSDAVMSATAALTSQPPFHNDANQPTEISHQLGSQIRGPSASL
ncbi:unnamed protein product [Prunus armeniaca]